MKTKYLGYILSFLFLFSVEVSFAQTTQEKVVAELNDFFNYLYKEQMFNGVVGVRYKGDIIFKKGYGKGNFETGTLFTPASQTELASVSKQFTATAIMILWKEGKLQLDDNINQYFDPELPYGGVTIKHLLSHQSGLPEYNDLFKNGWDPKQVATNEDIVRLLIGSQPPVFSKPGTAYKYSNLGYVLLAQIVKKVSGKELDEFLKEHIFLPFGMSSTGFYSRPSIYSMPLYAPGVIPDKDSNKYIRPENVERRQYVWYLSGRFGPGRLTSSVNDLLKWDSLLYTNSVLPQPILKEMFTPAIEIKDSPDSYGSGWRIVNANPSIVYHTGSWPGNLTYFKRYTKDKSTIIILNNTSSKYMKTIRSTTDAIIEGRKWDYPKKL